MLHEVFLALSGHPSPLFENKGAEDVPYISPAELSLLGALGHLANLHRLLRERLHQISQKHRSVICRSVGTSLRNVHLARFQRAVVDAERRILLKDASSVGAYDIVPLAAISADFEPWKRRLEWYWSLVDFMDPASAKESVRQDAKASVKQCNGVQLLDRLQTEAQTGFQDIETVASELLAVGERSWSKFLAQWIATGAVPPQASHDFFIIQEDLLDAVFTATKIDKQLHPRFVTDATASSILFLGRTISMLQSSATTQAMASLNLGLKNSPITAQMLQTLASLPSPLTTTRLSRVISEMRSSLAQEVVQQVLPTQNFVQVITMLRQFFLCERNDFTDALVHEADSYIATRHRQLQAGHRTTTDNGLAGVMMKAGEVKAVLNRTFTALAPFISKDALVDEDLEWMKERCSLDIASVQPPSTPSSLAVDVRFKDFLLLTPTELTLRLDRTFDIFFDIKDLNIYSAIHSYLLAIRRGHNHLSDLWRNAKLRRDHPAPITPRKGKGSASFFDDIKRRRAMAVSRMAALKSTWNSASAAVSLLAELGHYFTIEVIEESWRTFQTWIDPEVSTSSATKQLPHDPEVLAQAHRQYLHAVASMLLLSNAPFTKTLRLLLTHIDHFVALLARLQSAQHNSDLQDEGVLESHGRKYAEDAATIPAELGTATSRLESSMQKLLAELRRASGEARTRSTANSAFDTSFQPFANNGGIDRLLVRLDFRTATDVGEG